MVWEAEAVRGQDGFSLVEVSSWEGHTFLENHFVCSKGSRLETLQKVVKLLLQGENEAGHQRLLTLISIRKEKFSESRC